MLKKIWKAWKNILVESHGISKVIDRVHIFLCPEVNLKKSSELKSLKWKFI